jgi:DNA-binding NtrC family response regulator
MSDRAVTQTLVRGGQTVRLVRACALEVTAGPDAGRQAVVDRALFRIGAHPSNDLVLSDPTVSQHHLEIRSEPDAYRIVDLDSSNGTFAGSLRLTEVATASPLCLELGSSTLRLRPLDHSVQIPALEDPRFGSLVGRSAPMRELFWQLSSAARSDVTVLLDGETGVGKERAAESLHLASARRGGPWVVVDCSALVGSLVEAELFGYHQGAFSGATSSRTGLLPAADGGTLFLDEIGELPLALQVKLLGALERRRVQPLGSSAPVSFDARVIAASHRDLAREVNQGRFRADLFYRLSVLRIRIPPLRERLEDLPLLVEAVLADLRVSLGESVPSSLSSLALARLQSQPWPGNVRELRNAVTQALVGMVTPRPDAPPLEPFLAARARARERFERGYLTDLLARIGGNTSEAARQSGLDRRYLLRILTRLGLRS